MEHWEQGWMRWSSRSFEVYLEPGPESHQLSIRVYTGDSALGKEINGSVDIEWALDRLVFLSLAKKSFTLPSVYWTDLIADLPPSHSPRGLLRVLIKMDKPRVPARLLSASQDERELGLAVFGLAVT